MKIIFQKVTLSPKRVIAFWIIMFVCHTMTSCKKLVEAGAPRTSLSQANVYANEASAISVLTGLYQQISQDNQLSGRNSISLTSGLAADEFNLAQEVPSTDLLRYHFVDSLFSNISGSAGTQYWSYFYNYIFECNSAIQGLSSADKLTPRVKNQLLGESKFMRAFFYFYLTNLYGDVPLVLTNDWKANSFLARTTKNVVYQQIIADLLAAQELLSDTYLDGSLQPYSGTVERVRPTKWAATALLARVYLYTQDWTNAETQASAVINKTSLYNLASINEVFLKNSMEAIWQIQPVFSGQNTADGILFLLPNTGPSNNFPVYLSPHLMSAFENDDKRRYNRNWVDSVIVGSTNYFFPYKYKAGFSSDITSVSALSEYLMVLRLGEQYLIRAEARARTNNVGGAQNDLNFIRGRAGLSNTGANDQSSLLNAMAHERQVELFSEFGHRWFDLKRTGSIDAVMSVIRPLKAGGAPWNGYMQLYPILFSDIQKNTNLSQNIGY